MSSNQHTNKRTPSTTFAWRKVRISTAPQAEAPTAGRRPSPAPSAARDMRKPLTVTVVYRGGSEAWWELRARGLVVRRPGHVCLDDVLRELAK